MLGIIAWLGIDAVVVGEGRAPWLALATMLFLVPLVFAYTLRPAVFVNDDRLRVRNPLRLVVLPWGQVASLRSGFSNEVVDDSGTTYQLWALPVSVRARSKAARQEARAARAAARAGQGGAGGGRGDGRGGAGVPGGAVGAADLGAGAALAAGGPRRAETDRAMDELRELHERRQEAAGAQGESPCGGRTRSSRRRWRGPCCWACCGDGLRADSVLAPWRRGAVAPWRCDSGAA